jgi:predicted small lipoprotein YifL
MKKEKRFSAEDSRWTRRNNCAPSAREVRQQFLCDLRETSASSALSLLKLVTVLAFVASVAGCGTKTELLKPDGKATARDEKDPSQPPSPISR